VQACPLLPGLGEQGFAVLEVDARVGVSLELLDDFVVEIGYDAPFSRFQF
jgi:hypothetical protein